MHSVGIQRPTCVTTPLRSSITETQLKLDQHAEDVPVQYSFRGPDYIAILFFLN